MSKNVNITISADSSGVDKAAKSASSSISGMGKSALSAGSSFGLLQGGLLGIGFAVAKAGIDAISQSLDGAVRRVDTMNNFPKMMSNLGISSDEARKSISVLSDKLVGLPTTLDDAVSTVQRLTAVNNDLKGSTGAFLAINNAILAGNAPMEQQKTALEQLSQAYSKGKPDMMEWRAMLSAMPAQLQQVSKSMGLSGINELQQGLTSGKISMTDFINEIIKLNNQGLPGFQSFEEQARNSTGGIQTSLANLKNAFVRLTAGIIDAIGQANISAFLNGISKAITAAIPYVQAFIRILSMALSAVLSLFGGGAKKAQEVSNAMKASAISAGGAGGGSGGLAGGAKQADKALGGAAKKAKELKKQLASFDEMKTLQDPLPDSGSGGSGGKGGGGGSGDGGGVGGAIQGVDGLFDNLDGMGNKVDEIVNNILGSLNKLWEAFKQTETFKAIAGAVEEIWNVLSTRLGSIFSSIGTTFSSLMEAFQKETNERLPEIDLAFAEFFGGFGHLVAETFNLALMPIDGFFKGFSEVISANAPQIATDFYNTLLPLVATSGEIAGEIGNSFHAISEAWEPGFQSLGQLAGQFFTDLLNTSGNNMPQIAADFKDLATNAIDSLTQIGTTGGNIWSTFMSSMKKLWDENGKGVLDGIFKFVDNVIQQFNRFIADVLNPIIKPFLQEFEQVWKSSIQPMIDEVVRFVAKLIKAATDIYNGFIAPINNFISGILAPVFVTFGSIIGGVFNTIIKTVADFVGGFFGFLNGILDFISGIFTGNWSKAWEGVKGMFRSIVSGFGAIIKAPINLIINIINGFIDGLRNIKIPDWVPGVGGKGINIPRIPLLARGGVVNKATMAVIGEAGQEAVMPLENNTGWIDKLAGQIAGKGGVGTNNDQPIMLNVQIGDETIYSKVIEGINNKTFMSGENQIFV